MPYMERKPLRRMQNRQRIIWTFDLLLLIKTHSILIMLLLCIDFSKLYRAVSASQYIQLKFHYEPCMGS